MARRRTCQRGGVGRSALETALERQIALVGLPAPQTEFRFDPSRRWRFDFAWTPLKVACEVEGGTWMAGRHSRGAGFERDTEKYAAALVQGWRVLRVTAKQVASGEALTWLQQLLVGGEEPR